MSSQPLQTLTFEAPEESVATLDEIAASLSADRATVLREALAMYLADYEHLKAEAEEADREIDAGNFLTQEQVEAWLETQVSGRAAA